MLLKCRPIYDDEYGFDSSPLEVSFPVWLILTVARIWVAGGFIFSAVVGGLIIAVITPMLLPVYLVWTMVSSAKEEFCRKTATS